MSTGSGISLIKLIVETDETFLEVSRTSLSDLPDIEIDEAHGEHMICKESELVFVVGVVGVKSVPEKGDLLLLLRAFERKRQIVVQF
jgi:hypothetical protein